MDNTEVYYTPRQVADILKVKETTIWQWLKEGKLKGVHLGRLWRIRQSQLNEFLS